ncbi:MAG: site-2 protease family protein [Actinobacteria bacterium]|nr:site-2 protease family protein [Actinomycetota bacterium]
MHGKVAEILGDSTAREQGRLSLNPIKHLDLMGTLVLIITQRIGWAKPVPVNPYHFRDPIKHMALVGLAGPMANFATAFVLARLFYLPLPDIFGLLLAVTVQLNVILGIFNLLPIPPLDGSKIIPYFLPKTMQQPWYRFEQYGFIILLLLIFMVPGFLRTVLWYPSEIVLKLIYMGMPIS